MRCTARDGLSGGRSGWHLRWATRAGVARRGLKVLIPGGTEGGRVHTRSQCSRQPQRPEWPSPNGNFTHPAAPPAEWSEPHCPASYAHPLPSDWPALPTSAGWLTTRLLASQPGRGAPAPCGPCRPGASSSSCQASACLRLQPHSGKTASSASVVAIGQAAPRLGPRNSCASTPAEQQLELGGVEAVHRFFQNELDYDTDECTFSGGRTTGPPPPCRISSASGLRRMKTTLWVNTVAFDAGSPLASCG